MRETDREFLERVAGDVEAWGAEMDGAEPGVVERLRDIARRVGKGGVEVVEQRTAMKTAGAAPDGWSWVDFNRYFTGYFGTIRLQRGEPVLEQDGHDLIFRQGEVSLTHRQIPIYLRLSTLEAVTVIVVKGFMGNRQWFMTFEDGVQSGIRYMDEVGAFLHGWLSHAHANPVAGWKREIKRAATRQMQL